MAKFKKAASLFSALLLCGSLFCGVACKKGGDNSGDCSSSSSESTYIPPDPSVFTLENHTWTDWETVTEKTCTRDGKQQLVCTDEGCGAIKTRTIKKGHVFGDWTGNMDMLCQQSTTISHTCTDCGHTETQTVAQRAHAYIDGVCKECDTPFAFPTLKTNPSYVDAWNTSIMGNGTSFDRKELKAETYYTMEVPVTNPEEDDGGGVWISVSVEGPGQYALLTIGSANDVVIDRFDANDFYINPDKMTALIHENGASYSLVNCGEAYWNTVWRATWRFTSETATTVKFVVMKIADAEWSPMAIHHDAVPTQIKNVTADNPPASYTAMPVDYNATYYFDEWNEVYRLGTKQNPGEVIYVAIDTAATRLFGEKKFTNIQEDGNNLSFSVGTDEQGNYLIRDYHSFLLASESADGNAYENFVNGRGTYPVTKELREFLQLYTQKNRPMDIPQSILDNDTERAEKAWLAPCYFYSEIEPGTEDNPFVINQLGNFEASPADFDFVYFKLNYMGEDGTLTTKVKISCDDTNAMITIDGKTYQGPFAIEVDVDAMGVLFKVSSANFMAANFTLNLSLAAN